MKSIVVDGYSKKGPVLLVHGIVAAAVLLLSVNVYATRVLDNFTDEFDFFGSPVVVATGVGSSVCGEANQNGGIIIGEQRDVSITVTQGSNSSQVEVQVQDFAGLNVLSISTQSLTRGNVILQWDGNSEADDQSDTNVCSLDPTGLGGMDLTYSGDDQFNLEVVENDKAGTVLIIRVYTNATEWSEYEFTLLGITIFGSPETYVMKYSDFTQGVGASGPADFTNVGAIELEAENTPTSLDLSFDWLVTAVTYDETADSVENGEVCWGTATETDNEGFVVGRCLPDMSECEGLGWVDAEGVNGNGANYCFTTPLDPGYLYGVMDIDKDGEAGDPHLSGEI